MSDWLDDLWHPTAQEQAEAVAWAEADLVDGGPLPDWGDD